MRLIEFIERYEQDRVPNTSARGAAPAHHP